jgi:RNA polymerase sigma factor (sigma-70 family)
MTDDRTEAEQNRRIEAAIQHEEERLRQFIRGRVPDSELVEDILQDVFYELIVAYRFLKPVEHVGAWLFRVARNRIYDTFRKRKRTPIVETKSHHDDEPFSLEDWIPSADAGPQAAFVRSVLFDELEEAIDELPDDQRYVFIAHEVHRRSFNELSVETGLSVNTLLSRKRYAVTRLRRRLQDTYNYLFDVQGENK